MDAKAADVERELLVINRLGLHARAAAKLVNVAGRFQSELQLVRGHRVVNAKSIMGVMMLAAAQGSSVQLRASGADADAAAEALVALFARRFDEDS